MNKLLFFLFFSFCITSFLIGFAFGAKKATDEMMNVGVQVIQDALDIKLSQKSVDIIKHNPNLFPFIFEADLDYDNPFEDRPMASVKWEYCMITVNNYSRCYENIINKYGEF